MSQDQIWKDLLRAFFEVAQKFQSLLALVRSGVDEARLMPKNWIG